MEGGKGNTIGYVGSACAEVLCAAGGRVHSCIALWLKHANSLLVPIESMQLFGSERHTDVMWQSISRL
eukprot:2490788-Rhodomonas_salina.1